MSFRDKLFRFFYGRYGNDKLNYFIIGLYFVLLVVNIFVMNIFLYLAPLVLLVLVVFRTLSKNCTKRAAENRVYLKCRNTVISPFKRFFRRVRDIKTHRYRKCPACKKTLRLPNKKGKHSVICPCCKNRFNVNIRL